MRPRDWNRVGALFEEALRLQGADREAFVATLDQDDVTEEVRSLLAAHEGLGPFDELASFVNGPRVEQLLRLQPGEILGPYRIVREIASGGMAVVYEAEDLKHEREVAIKVLRPELAALLGAERFVREMKTTAQLQHPNILALFDSGEADGLLFYVMPYIEGETLRDRLDREKQLGVEEAVEIATEVADALDYAHRNGVIHRDIKPGNILLQEGRPLVADFGIALAVSTAGARTTESEIPLGTPHYMSPEQAAQKELTPRTDIYSLGCVLYEMLAGDPPHVGASAGQILQQILTEEPQPVDELRKTVPPNVAAALGRSLQKLPADRFDRASALGRALNDPLFAVPRVFGPRSRWNRLAVGLATATLLAVAAGSWGWVRSWRLQPVRPVVEFTLLPPEPTMYFGDELALSPDGRRLAAEVLTPDGWALYERTLDSREWRIVGDTKGARGPFFSADGAWLGYFSSSDRAVTKVAVEGGPARTIARAAWMGGASWGSDNTIVFQTKEDPSTATPPGLYRVSAEGGTPQLLLRADSALPPIHGSPHWLPGSDVLLFKSGIAPPYVSALSLATGEAVRLVPGISPSGDGADRLTYVTPDGSLVLHDFDASNLTLIGAPRSLGERISIRVGGHAPYTVAGDGSLAYLAAAEPETHLLLVDRQGASRVLFTPGIGSLIGSPRFSPDGDRIAFAQDGDIWVYSRVQGTARRLSFEQGFAVDPAWTNDGLSVGYSVAGRGADSLPASVWLRAADGTGDAVQIIDGDTDLWEIDFGPGDDEVVLFSVDNLYRVALRDSTILEPLMDTESYIAHGTLSPNGRWIAYRSNESGVNEVYIRSYPEMGPATLVSKGGGSAPAWSSNGGEIFYWGAGQMNVASLEVESTGLTVVNRTALFHSGPFQEEWNRSYDVNPDGTEFVLVSRPNTRIVWKTNALSAP